MDPGVNFSRIKFRSLSRTDFRFSSLRALNKHIEERHLQLKPFKCTQCDFATSRNGSLKKHIKAVHENKVTCKGS